MGAAVRPARAQIPPSARQKQRIAIARGLLRDARILILDESISALDPETEAYLVDALHEAVQDKLVTVIAHRLSTIAADFALTEKYLDEPYRDHSVQDPKAIPKPHAADPSLQAAPLPVYLYSCLPKTMVLALEFLDEEYGGTDGYLRARGFNDKHFEQLRAKLLD